MKSVSLRAVAAPIVLASLAGAPAHAMDLEEAQAVCITWQLRCPAGTEAFGGGRLRYAFCRKPGATSSQSVKHGPLVSCTEDGRLKGLVHFSEGRRHGLTVTVRPDGSRTETHFTDGEREGREVHVRSDGTVAFEDVYARGVRVRRSIPARTGASEELKLSLPGAGGAQVATPGGP